VDVAFDQVGRFRRSLALWRKCAWLFLVFSIFAVIAWESITGPGPADFGYRFSPMYTFSVTGFFFWYFVLCVLAAVALINYLYLGIKVRLHCPSCMHTISSKDDWVCAYCRTENRPRYGGAKDSYYTLLAECGHCLRSPESYMCGNCGTVTAFEQGGDDKVFAYKPQRSET
jgi:hypothetical protein